MNGCKNLCLREPLVTTDRSKSQVYDGNTMFCSECQRFFYINGSRGRCRCCGIKCRITPWHSVLRRKGGDTRRRIE